ncbi:MAG: SurA N-terminal domain-containing protein [Balneolaceae bacterium]
MGVMEKMRNSTASILWVLIFSFGLLWVLADTQVFDALSVGPQSLGQVNGDEISFEEYNSRVSYYTDQFNQQTGGGMSSEMRSLYEQQAWEDLVAARLVEQKMNELGITVTDRELINMITGDNPDPFIRQQFQAEDGTIDRIALRAAIESPENSEVWVMIEQQLRENRRQQKMNNFIASGLRVSSLDIEKAYVADNSYADIRYIRFPYGDVTNDEITISDRDLRDYYSNNPSQFERSESYRFRYVSWDKTPTSEDTLRTVNEVEELRESFAAAEDDSLFLLRYQSEASFRGNYTHVNEIRGEYSPVIDLEPGEVSDVVMINGDPHVFKKIDQRGDEIKFGILTYNVQADAIATIDRLAEEADEFQYYASSDGFTEEAERRDLQFNEASATKNNPVIPGFGQSQMVLNTLEGLSRNDISDPIELDDQIVVIQMLERTPEGVRPLEEVRNQVENRVRNQKRQEMMSQRVQNLLNESSDFETIASAADKEIQTAGNIRMSSSRITGAGREPKVVGAVFRMEEGQQSPPVAGENAIFIVVVDELDMADASQMSSADRREIQNQLEQEKFGSFNTVFIEKMKEEANIKDNRSRVLR